MQDIMENVYIFKNFSEYIKTVIFLNYSCNVPFMYMFVLKHHKSKFVPFTV